MSPFRRRFLALLVGLGVGAVGLEAALRVGGLGVRRQLGLFQVGEAGDIVLAPCASDRVRGPDAVVTQVYTGPDGLRSAVACEATSSDIVIVGDSQVFGLGVRHEDTFSARLGARNAGVPDYGVADALALGRGALSGASVIVIVVNQANDWADGTARSAERNVIRYGYLLRKDRLDAPGAWLWSTPLARSALLYQIWLRLAPLPPPPPPEWLRNPAGEGAMTRALATLILDFAQSLPVVRVVPVWLPADLATSEARSRLSPLAPAEAIALARPWADTTLRDDLAAALAPMPLVDLSPSLIAPDSFLPHDFHLSAAGHAAVAEQLRPWVEGARR